MHIIITRFSENEPEREGPTLSDDGDVIIMITYNTLYSLSIHFICYIHHTKLKHASSYIIPSAAPLSSSSQVHRVVVALFFYFVL